MAIKNKRGALGLEIGIAIVIFTLFATALIGTRINLASKLEELEMKSTATKIAMQSLERVSLEQYDLINNIDQGSVFENNKEYVVDYSIEKYSDTKPNKKDLIKIVTVTVSYNVRGKAQAYTLSTLVTRK